MVLLLAAACGRAPAMPQQVFVTDYGLGPDKWATAWLLTKHVAPGAKLVVVDPAQSLPSGTSFDVPGSELQRKGDRAAFEVVLDTYGLSDPDVRRFAQIVHDIEVNFWAPEKMAEAPLVEQAFRDLQRGQAHGTVSPECYVAFFDRVYQAVKSQRTQGVAISLDALSVDCSATVLTSSSDLLVPEMPIPELLAEMKRGKSIVFVDVREADEFSEAHIPDALNITLRNLDQHAIDKVKGADYVVSYCVKDFRGFEMAKALRDAGVGNAVILNPYGLKGWLSQGLPLVGTQALGEADAARQLASCMASSNGCVTPAVRH